MTFNNQLDQKLWHTSNVLHHLNVIAQWEQTVHMHTANSELLCNSKTTPFKLFTLEQHHALLPLHTRVQASRFFIGHCPLCVYPLSTWCHHRWPDRPGLPPPYLHTRKCWRWKQPGNEVWRAEFEVYSVPMAWRPECSQGSINTTLNRNGNCRALTHMPQDFSLCICILQATQDWRWERPGNKATCITLHNLNSASLSNTTHFLPDYNEDEDSYQFQPHEASIHVDTWLSGCVNLQLQDTRPKSKQLLLLL